MMVKDDVLCLDALIFAEELADAYQRRVRPKVDTDNAFRVNMETRLEESAHSIEAADEFAFGPYE